MEYSTAVLESQPDWLTFATHHQNHTDVLEPHLGAWFALERAEGNTVHPWKLQGYNGSRCGRVRFGRKGTATLVQLSGDLARRHWEVAARLQDNVSRLDVAVTVQPRPPDVHLALASYNEAKAAFGEEHLKALPRMVTDGAGGATLYVGDRSSDTFLRLYNKEAEAWSRKDYDEAARYIGAWRYEVEYKGERARTAFYTLKGAQFAPDACRDLVYDAFFTHHITPAFTPASRMRLLPGFRRRTDNDRRLEWFRSGVAPAVKALLESDRRAEVEDALGLTTPEQPF